MGLHHRAGQRPPFRARLRADGRFRLEVEQARAHSVPYSIFTGRAWPLPGEPLFLPADTEMALALAEEERDTCPACGLPKVWCRENEGGRWRFDVAEEFCWATYRIASKQDTGTWKKAHEPTRQATQMRVKFRPGHEPSMTAGLAMRGKEVPAGG